MKTLPIGISTLHTSGHPVDRTAEQHVPRSATAGYAIDAIRTYVQAGRDVMLIGMDFSRRERNLVGFGFEEHNEQ